MSNPAEHIAAHLEGRRYARFVIDVEVEVTDRLALAAENIRHVADGTVPRSAEAEIIRGIQYALADGFSQADGLSLRVASVSPRVPDQGGDFYREVTLGPVPITRADGTTAVDG